MHFYVVIIISFPGKDNLSKGFLFLDFIFPNLLLLTYATRRAAPITSGAST